MPKYILETSQEKVVVSQIKDDGKMHIIPTEGARNLLNYAIDMLHWMAGYKPVTCVVPYGDERDLEPWPVYVPDAPEIGSDCPRCGQKIKKSDEQEEKNHPRWDDGLIPGEMIF